MALNVGTLEALLVLRDQLSPALAAVERTIKGAGGTMNGWTEAEQRAAMAMAGMHAEALRMNAAIEASARAATAAAASTNTWTEAQQQAVVQMNSMHAEALKLNKEFDNEHGLAGKLSKTGEKLSAVGGGMQSAGMAFLPLTGIIAGIGGASIAAAGQFQQTKIAFETMLGSAEKADKFLKDMRAFAQQTPFEFNDVTAAAKRLMALGFSAEQVLPTLRTVGDAVAGLGGGAPMIDRVTLALGQMQAKGKVSAQEMNQLAESGIPAWELLAKSIGVSIPQAMKKAEGGAIMASQAIPAILEGMQAKFGGLMEKQSKTVLGQWSNTMDKLAEMAVKVGDAMLPAVDAIVGALNAALPYVVKLIDVFTALPAPIQMTVLGILAAVAAIGPLLLVAGTLVSSIGAIITAVGAAIPVMGTLGTAATAAAGAISAAGAAMGITAGAFVAGAAAVVAVGAAVYKLTSYLVENTEAGNALVTMLSNLILKLQGVNLKALEAGTGVSQQAKDYAKWWGEQQAAQRKADEALGEGVKIKAQDVAMTDAQIKAAIAKKNEDELIKKATNELGAEVKDLATARRVLAQIDAEKKMTADIEKGKETVRKFREEVEELLKTFQSGGRGQGFLIPPLPPIPPAVKEDINQIAEGAWKATDAIVAQGIQLAKNGVPADTIREKLAATGLTASQIEQVMAQIGVAMDKLPPKGDTFGTVLRNIAQAAVMLGSIFGGTFEAIGNALGQIHDGWQQYLSDMSKATTEQEKFVAKMGLVSTALNALGGVLGSSGSRTGQLAGAALQGAAAGAKMGAAFGPVGAIIGGVGGAVLGFIGKSKRMKAEMKALNEEFQKAHGGLDKLRAKAGEAGISLAAVNKAKTPEQLKAAIEQTNAQFAAFDDLLSSIGGKTMTDLKVAAAQAGVSLDAMLNAKTPEQYIAAVEAVKERLATWEEATKKVQEAMDRYGITVSEMGPKWQQQELDKKAAQLLEDYRLLVAAGADVNLVIERMGPAFTEYVQSVIAGGATIPEALRPAIEKLIENRQLLDENGNAYTSVEESGVKFAKTQSEMFDSLIEKIDKLVSALLGIPTDINTNVNVRTNYTGGQQPPEDPNIEQPVYAAAGFHGWVSRPTPFVAGEDGPEYVSVTPRGKSAAKGAGGGGGDPIVANVTVPLVLDGVELGRTVFNLSRTGALRVDASSVVTR